MDVSFGNDLRSYLLETRGIANGYGIIVDEIFEKISNTKPILVDNGIYMVRFDNYKV